MHRKFAAFFVVLSSRNIILVSGCTLFQFIAQTRQHSSSLASTLTVRIVRVLIVLIPVSILSLQVAKLDVTHLLHHISTITWVKKNASYSIVHDGKNQVQVKIGKIFS